MKSETFLLKLEPEEKKILSNSAWLKKVSMAEYLRIFIRKGRKKNERMGKKSANI